MKSSSWLWNSTPFAFARARMSSSLPDGLSSAWSLMSIACMAPAMRAEAKSLFICFLLIILLFTARLNIFVKIPEISLIKD
jgi:hypothetical protein